MGFTLLDKNPSQKSETPMVRRVNPQLESLVDATVWVTLHGQISSIADHGSRDQHSHSSICQTALDC